jgi:hypothetical protein
MQVRIVGMHQQYSFVARCSSRAPLRQLLSYLSDIIAGVKLETFFENLDQMEPARIPNDREHEFSIELRVVLLREFFCTSPAF